MTAKAPVRHCAVYTRKSSEEGLEQNFNSLHAQREACEAFIRSQRGEGWRLIETAYDDGGLSGGTLERPALQRLFADIAQHRVETVVVYKVDRLTRSLMDFAKIVELFDRHGHLRRGHPAVQHNDVNGTAHPQHPAVLRPVRARGYWRARPRQDRSLQEEGDVDGRGHPARLRDRGSQAGHRSRRGRDGAADLFPIPGARLGATAQARPR